MVGFGGLLDGVGYFEVVGVFLLEEFIFVVGIQCYVGDS